MIHYLTLELNKNGMNNNGEIIEKNEKFGDMINTLFPYIIILKKLINNFLSQNTKNF